MKLLLSSCIVLLLAVLPAVAGPVSYVVLNGSGSTSLEGVGPDGYSLRPIATGAGGSGLALDTNGNYIVAAVGSLLRVDPSGAVGANVAPIALAPSGSQWMSVAVDSSGNFIVADNVQHAVWRVSPSGLVVTKVANYPVSSPSEGEATGITVDPSGNYLVMEGNGGHANFFSITPAGAVTAIPLTGAAAASASGLTSDGSGNYLFTSYSDHSVFRVTLAGAVTLYAHDDTALCCNATGLARNPDTGEVIVSLNGAHGISTPRLTRISPNGLMSTLDSGGVFSYPNAVIAVTSAGLPHLALGGTWTAGFFVANTSLLPANFTIRFFGDTGSPVSLPFGGMLGNVSVLTDTVPVQGMKYYEAANPSIGVFGGWGLVTADPSITVQALFRSHAPDGNFYEAAVPASFGNFRFIIPFDDTTFAPTGDPYYTGFAIANLNPSVAANVQCSAYNAAGTLIPDAITVPALNPLGHWANYLFPALYGQRGTIECTALTVPINTPIAAIALRFIGNNAFTSLPVIYTFFVPIFIT